MRKCYAYIVASLHRQPGRPYYFCAYTLSDGKRVFRSTGTKNKREAERIGRSWDQAAREARNGLLTVDRAREILERGLSDIYRIGSGEAMPDSSLGAWIDLWIESKKLETTPATLVRYENTIKGFKAALAGRLTKPIAAVTVQDILKWREARGRTVKAKTINVDLKTIRSLFSDAVRSGLLTVNPATRVKVLKQSETTRRPFTVAELRRLLVAAKGEWKGLILMGVYTGQRLGDLARLTWRQVNMETGELNFVTAKTGKRLTFPLVQPLADYLGEQVAPDDPDAPLFPKAASAVRKAGRVVTLSNQFYGLMVEAGLAKVRTHEGKGEGRGARRVGQGISFHSIRHAAVTMLKQAGVSDAMAGQIIGHESEAVSRQYTHLTTQDIRRAVEKLPDLTAQ